MLAQGPPAARGAGVFRTNCAVAYCHGANGTAGRAPKLLGNSYPINSLFRMVSWGIPGTGMPGFTRQLKTDEIQAVVAYVMTLGGERVSGPVRKQTTPAPPGASEGRALFFDAARTGACGSCHELDGWGAAVGPDLSGLTPARLSDLRGVSASSMKTARPTDGEPAFPAVLVEQTDRVIRVYDLTAPLPVLRSFAAGRVVVDAGSGWRHADATLIYNDGELAKIARHLRWVSSGRH